MIWYEHKFITQSKALIRYNRKMKRYELEWYWKSPSMPPGRDVRTENIHKEIKFKTRKGAEDYLNQYKYRKAKKAWWQK